MIRQKMQQIWPYKEKVIYKAWDIEFTVVDLPYEEIKKIQEQKKKVRQWSKKIIDDWLEGKIEDISEFVNLERGNV